jgi:predicted small metal-binding protein
MAQAHEEALMAKIINCECGYTVEGESEDEVLANAEAHVQRDHPDLVGQISRDDLRGLVEER